MNPVAQEGRFSLDRRGRIAEWDAGAVAITGVSARDAEGRPCSEVVQGVDALYRPLCGEHCPAFRSLEKGHLTGGASLRLAREKRPEGAWFRCQLTALPSSWGGAVGRLRAADRSGRATARRGRADSQMAGRSSLTSDLAVLATLTDSLSPKSFPASLERALDMLREATGAEAAEVFLPEPDGQGMVLTCYRGLFRHAFAEMPRFGPGEGFPGIVLTRHEPILTNRLSDDPRYLRTRVKDHGFHSYVCVPLPGSIGGEGSINLAFRRPDADLDRTLRLLAWAAVPIGMLVEVAFRGRREAVSQSPPPPAGAGSGDVNQVMGDVLRKMLEVSDAQGGVMTVTASTAGQLSRKIREGRTPSRACPALEKSGPGACPAREERRGLVLFGPKRSWAPPCQEARGGAGIAVCIPFVAEGECVAVGQLFYERRGVDPPTRNLAILEAMGEAAAPVIQSTLRIEESRRRTEAVYEAALEANAGSVEGPSSHHDASRTGTPWPSHVAPREEFPAVDIRCLGPFELYRQARLVTPDQVHRRQSLRLLKILLAHEGRPVSSEVLIEGLWPELDPSRGIGRLYVLVHELRRVLEPEARSGEWTYVRTQGDQYYFNLDGSCRFDVREFKKRSQAVKQLLGTQRAEAALRACEAAAELYRGDFLEDEPFEEWSWPEREQLRETYLSVLQTLGTLYSSRGEWARSVQTFQAALRVDSLREEFHRALMKALWMAGRRDEAVKQYGVCKDLLRRELSIAPADETNALHAQLRESSAQPND